MFRPLTRNPLLNAGLQKGSNTGVFQRPDAIGAESPCTIPDVLCQTGGINLGGWYAVRIKRTPSVEYTLTGIYSDMGTNNSGAPVDAAMSIYQMVREDGFPRMRRMLYFPYTVANGGDFGDEPGQHMFDSGSVVLKPEKHYAFVFWVGAAACASLNVVHYATTGSMARGAAYDANVSRDQPVLKIRGSSDPLQVPSMAGTTNLIVPAMFYAAENDLFLMY